MNAMLEGGEDPNFIFRRMAIFASEDIGMADPYALTEVQAAHESFIKSGMPEGFYFLSHACLFLSLSAKSNSTKEIIEVNNEIKKNRVKPITQKIKDKKANNVSSSYLGIENA